MARKLIAALVPVMALAVLAGCGTPAGTDKDLTDDWAMLTTPKIPPPPVGACYSTSVDYFATATTTQFSFKSVDSCSSSHASETFYVGDLTGAAASGTTPPKGEALKDGWTKCNTEAEKFLGGSYYDGRLELLVLVPSSTQWSAGARYLRCDLAEVVSDGDKPVSRSGSLKGALSGDKPLALGCAMEVYDTDGKTWLDYTPTTCTATHNMEYVGTYTSTDRPFPSNSDERKTAMRPGCEALGAKYLGMTASQLTNHQQVGIGFWMVDEENWNRGNRSARCYAMLFDKKTVTKSIKGMGSGAI
ncbi:septum formation family protein [Dactylosporangium sp. NPDC000244]|uniref:septum formation family protein n=1 Tax=Dactylosporangium sp. NPDC000244 TaxID=3154365 RepID=UPI003319627D